MNQYLSVFSPNTGKYGPEITPYLDTFHALFMVTKCDKTGEFESSTRVLFTCILHKRSYVQIRSYFWSVFSCIRTEYGEILHISPYSVRIKENTDLK